MGTAIAGTILIAGLARGPYASAMVALAVFGLIGLVAALFLPRQVQEQERPSPQPLLDTGSTT